MCGIWGSYYNIPTAIFYLLKRDYNTIWITIATIFPGITTTVIASMYIITIMWLKLVPRSAHGRLLSRGLVFRVLIMIALVISFQRGLF